jgi:hypothetical protein
MGESVRLFVIGEKSEELAIELMMKHFKGLQLMCEEAL